MNAGPDRPDEASVQVARLRRRLDRERATRQEAERIAEIQTRHLFEANEDLDRKVEERTAELDRMLIEVSRTSEAKSAFLAELTHQMRTPLHGLMGLVELIDGQHLDPDNAVPLSAAFRAAGRLDRLVGRLATYTDLIATDLTSDPKPRPVRDVVGEVQDRWAPRCLRAGQLLSIEQVEDTDFLVADATLDLAIGEVMANVVEHAGAGAVRISARSTGDTVRLEILDPGPGLSSELKDRVHRLELAPDPSHQADHPLPLGLLLLDVACRALGGDWDPVTVDSTHGVVLSLPARTARTSR